MTIHSDSAVSRPRSKPRSKLLNWAVGILLTISLAVIAIYSILDSSMNGVEAAVRHFPSRRHGSPSEGWKPLPNGSRVTYAGSEVARLTAVELVRVALPDRDSVIVYTGRWRDSSNVNVVQNGTSLIGILSTVTDNGTHVIDLVRRPTSLKGPELGILRIEGSSLQWDVYASPPE